MIEYATNTRMTSLEPRPVLDDLTVVIPTLGRPILEESLSCIASGTAWPAKIIVVDQGSSLIVAGWLDRLSALGLRAEHVPSSQRGRAAAVNRGIERVKTRFVAVTDDDCFVNPEWLEKMAAILRDNPDAIISGRVESAGDEPVLIVVNGLESTVQRRPSLKHDSMCGGNMGVAVDVIQVVGLLDEDPCLRTAEDGEWSYRALKAGVPIIYAPDVVVQHFGWRDKSERMVQYADYAHSHGGFYGKYLRKGDWFIALRVAVHYLRALRRWMKGLITGDRELASCGRAYVFGLLPGIFAGLRTDKLR
jgi:glycosyltransferase involved in cell wall biosynthesis